MSNSSDEKLKVSICQMNSGEDPETNFLQLLDLLKASIDAGAELISFPENCLYMRVDDSSPRFAFSLNDKYFHELADICKSQKVCVHLGSVPIDESGKTKNSTIIIDDFGQVKRVYDKIHLFDIELEGKPPVKESDHFVAGNAPQIFTWRGFRFGLCICYDLRFAELFLAYAKLGVDALFIPAAFLVETGRAHWQVMMRARAIENQCFVIAAAQEGEHRSSSEKVRYTYGHSMIVDPWGEVQKEISSGVGMAVTELTKSKIELVRRQMPMASHRRL